MLFDSFFQAGNIITLAIVLIILAVYRQLDKDNRSLEKLKKFADRMKDDIGSFVDEKSRDMQNLAIELDVHQKTAKEILSRLGKSEEQLQERSGHLDEVRERIEGYDASLKELGTMTGKVEENLRRIASESEFVDTVAKRVKAVAGQLDGVEKSIPGIEQRLKQDSQKILEALKQDIIKGVYDDVGRLKKEARQAGEQVDEFPPSSLPCRRNRAIPNGNPSMPSVHPRTNCFRNWTAPVRILKTSSPRILNPWEQPCRKRLPGVSGPLWMTVATWRERSLIP